MKKAIGIIILGLLWCNVGFAGEEIIGWTIEVTHKKTKETFTATSIGFFKDPKHAKQDASQKAITQCWYDPDTLKKKKNKKEIGSKHCYVSAEFPLYKQVKNTEPSQTSDSNDIAQQLKDLDEMYKSGALTKEEFEKAKKKLLN